MIAPEHPLAPFATIAGAALVEDRALVVPGDAFAWLRGVPARSLDAVVTDPPYGGKEFEPGELARRTSGEGGGVWREPPRIGGSVRQPLPRFTALTASERAGLRDFYATLGVALARALKPGGHVLLAANALLALDVFGALADGGLEYRGAVIRVVRTLRGGDRPKGAEAEFPDVCTMPRSCHEPWGLFRAPLPPGMTVAACLRAHGTGALRREAPDVPFADVLPSTRTSRAERAIAKHPSVKPQALLRPLVRAALPLGRGVVADPFMGTGSTLAAALAQGAGVYAVGVERDAGFAAHAPTAIAALRAVLPLPAPEAPISEDLPADAYVEP